MYEEGAQVHTSIEKEKLEFVKNYQNFSGDKINCFPFETKFKHS